MKNTTDSVGSTAIPFENEKLIHDIINDIEHTINEINGEHKELLLEKSKLGDGFGEPLDNDNLRLNHGKLAKFEALNQHCEQLRIKLIETVSECRNLRNQLDKKEDHCKRLRKKAVKTAEELKKLYKGKKNIVNKYNNLVHKFNLLKSDNSDLDKAVDRGLVKYDSLVNKFNSLLKVNNNTIEEYTNLRNKLNKTEEENRNLKRRNNLLQKETSDYQCALGSAINFRLPDNDKNNSVFLNDDIIRLQGKIEKFTVTKGKYISIDVKATKELSNKYGCQRKIFDKNPDKSFIKAVLQRHVIMKILHYVETHDHQSLDEYEILRSSDELLEIIKIFIKNREASNNVSRAIPIKLRQQIYGLLSNIAFTNIVEGDNENTFIRDARAKLVDEISKYRVIKDDNKIVENENLASSLIREVIDIFYFRINIQEPAVEYIWIEENEKVDPVTMTGNWADADIDNCLVELCVFPLFGVDLMKSNRKVYTKAYVIIREIQASTNPAD